jgi:CRP/FNR family transcriptional regulator
LKTESALSNARSITVRPRPLIIEAGGGIDPCSSCDTRRESVCSAIKDSDLQRLASVAIVTEVDAGKTFVAEGDPANDFYNITAGCAKIYKLLPDGRRQITGFAQGGVFLGLAVSDVYAFSAEAITRVRYCRFPRRKLLTLMEDFPALEKTLLQTASNELVAAQEQMLLLGRKTARERLASFLLASHETAQPCGDGPEHIDLPMSRGDIADYLGLTIETISRTFTRLKNEKLIALPSNTRVDLIDPEGLADLAGGYASEE